MMTPAERDASLFTTDPCPICGGDGIEPGTVLVCDRCYGVGRILTNLVKASENRKLTQAP
uniref:DnaJ-like chaperonin n=1 Tax=Micrococcus phage Kurnik TaxID=3092208 RepID=A0AAU6R6C1_9CAUD